MTESSDMISAGHRIFLPRWGRHYEMSTRRQARIGQTSHKIHKLAMVSCNLTNLSLLCASSAVTLPFACSFMSISYPGIPKAISGTQLQKACKASYQTRSISEPTFFPGNNLSFLEILEC